MVNIAGVQVCQPVTFWFSFSQVIGQAVVVTDWLVAQCFPFQSTYTVFSWVALDMSPLTTEGTHFSTILSAFIFCRIFPNGHSDCCELIGFCNMGMHVIKISKIHHFSTPFSFLFKKKKKSVSTIYLLKVSSWNVALFWMFRSIFNPRIVLEGRCHLQACKFCEYLVILTNGFKAAVAGNGYNEVEFLHSQIWVLGQEPFWKSCSYVVN